MNAAELLTAYGFPLMSKVVPPAEHGEAKVTHFTVSDSESQFTHMRAAIGSDRHAGVSAGTYAKLLVGGKLMMTDTDMERRTNREFLRMANGHVLIAGLGLGMIVHPILTKDGIKSVHVIEKSEDVISLITPTLPKDSRLHVVCADIFEWMPPRGVKFDSAYFDIWPDRSEDNIDEASKLHRRFARRLNRENPRCWMGSWMIEELRAQRDRYRRF